MKKILLATLLTTCFTSSFAVLNPYIECGHDGKRPYGVCNFKKTIQINGKKATFSKVFYEAPSRFTQNKAKLIAIYKVLGQEEKKTIQIENDVRGITPSRFWHEIVVNLFLCKGIDGESSYWNKDEHGEPKKCEFELLPD